MHWGYTCGNNERNLRGCDMKTEVKPRIKSGFLVNEIELTRIKDAQNEQIKKISNGQDAIFSYEVKYINGLIDNPNSLTDITSEENDGSKSIIRLVIKSESATQIGSSITIQFSDISDRSNSDFFPISYEVISDDKDWTFVTSSMVEERINKVKISKMANFLFDGRGIGYISNIIMTLAFLYICVVFSNLGSDNLEKLKYIRENSKDILDYSYKVDIYSAQSAKELTNLPLILGFLLFLFMAGSYLRHLIKSWYPTYTFYWGDRVRKYDRKVSMIRFVLGGIIFAIIIGMAGNYFYDRLPFG
jgi:hypothetical protein